MIPIEIFSHNATKVSVPAGQALLQEGAEGNLMYVLETGVAEVFVQKSTR